MVKRGIEYFKDKHNPLHKTAYGGTFYKPWLPNSSLYIEYTPLNEKWQVQRKIYIKFTPIRISMEGTTKARFLDSDPETSISYLLSAQVFSGSVCSPADVDP